MVIQRGGDPCGLLWLRFHQRLRPGRMEMSQIRRGGKNCVLGRRTDVIRSLEGGLNVTSVRGSWESDLVSVVRA